MAKSKVVIVDDELTPTVLATVKDKKKTSIFGIFWIIIIFGIFITGVLHVDEILVYVNGYLGKDVDIKVTRPISSNQNEENQKENQKEEIKEYTISDDLEFTYNNLLLNKFSVKDNKINFTITNNNDKDISLNDSKYFMYLYNSNKKLLQIIMVGDKTLLSGSTNEFNYDLKDASVNIIKFVNVTTEEYPEYSISNVQKSTGILTCVKDEETMRYTFSSNVLAMVQNIIELDKNMNNYATLYTTYSSLSQVYDKQEGVTSTVSDSNDKTTIFTTINLDVAKIDNIGIKHVYKSGTKPNIIYFELTASGYNCN